MELPDITIYIQEIYRWPTLPLRSFAHVAVFIPLLSSFLSGIQRDRRTATDRERDRQTDRHRKKFSVTFGVKNGCPYMMYLLYILCLRFARLI